MACNPYEDDCHHNSAPTNPAPATGNNGNTGGGNSGCQADPNCDLSGGTGAGGLKKPKDEGSGACGAGGMVDCPPTVGLTYRDTITYHLLDSNVVYQTPIYDYSYYPQKLIGYQMKYYTRDEFHFSLKNLLLPSDPIMWASTIQTVGSELLKIGSSNLGKLAGFISPVCPECVATLSVVAGVDSVNNAITFDGHIVTQVYYFNQSPFETPYQTPFDPKKIP